MGQGKSSYSEGVAQQIGQQAVADVNARTLPQLASQAYQRYIDDQNRERANSMDLLGLSREFNSQHQQGLDNTFRQEQANLDNANRDRVFGEQQKQSNWDAYLQSVDRTGNLGTGPKVDYQLLGGMDGPASMQGQQFQYQQARDQIKDEQYKQQFDEDARRYGLDYALRAAAQANQFANSAADNARANASLGLQRERFEFDKQQAANKSTTGTGAKVDAKFSADNYDLIYEDLQSKGVTKDVARQLVEANRDQLSDSDYKKLREYINETF
jgi:hypothetical protein